MRSPKSPARSGPKSPNARAFDRHVPASGLRGLPKKGGAGGKGTWGGIMTADGPAAVDTHDPNYDSDGGDFSLDPVPAMDSRPVAHLSVVAPKVDKKDKVEKTPSLSSESGASL
eukprot:TRINITY_DN351_c0_g1_i4.p3 TRINITY_DN351_c0_g1~~TRINITY_DN351_c0_g1_i4.p3  ORF type:complete len:114 (+),score=18.94 TRINITY_DN351_c0_g1_i4:520-861(+)